jgi:hypothetical protein
MQGGGTLVRSINFEIEGRRLLDWEGDWDGHQAGSGPLDERTPPSLGLRPSGPPAGGVTKALPLAPQAGGQKHSTSQAVGQRGQQSMRHDGGGTRAFARLKFQHIAQSRIVEHPGVD